MAFPIILTISQVSEETHLSKATIYRLISASKLRPIHIGGSIRIPRAELERFLRQLSVEQHGVDITNFHVEDQR